MKTGLFEKAIKSDKIENIYKQIINENILEIKQKCEQYGENANEVRYYQVFKIKTLTGYKILKQGNAREVFVYENYLNGKNFDVPNYYGTTTHNGEIWIVLENLEGNDIRDMTDTITVTAADNLARIQNFYWKQCKKDNRFEVYINRISKRAEFVKKFPELETAYKIFIDRQLNCPKTFSHGDLLQSNVILQADGKLKFIDFGFSGEMPYSLDIARFIAHATETKSTFPFYMNDNQKELFVKRVYKKLIHKSNYDRYIFDIKLAVLNEYVEFIEADEDEDNWYLEHALKLSENILVNK